MPVAIVTVASGRHEHFHRQRQGVRAGDQQPDVHVVVAMDDPDLARMARDHGCVVIELPVGSARLPLAAARNVGAARALDLGADRLIFLDVDCVPGPTLVRRYSEHARQAPDAVLCGPVTYLPPPGPDGYDLNRLGELADPHPARPAPTGNEVVIGKDFRLFWSLSFAVAAVAWRRVGGFCEEYQGYGAEDTDFGQLAAQAGLGLQWVGGAPAFHQYHPTARPPVQHLDDILRNARIFYARWGWWPMSGWLAEFETLELLTFNGEKDEWSRTSVSPSRPVPPRTP